MFRIAVGFAEPDGPAPHHPVEVVSTAGKRRDTLRR
jgi:hypothetical protein